MDLVIPKFTGDDHISIIKWLSQLKNYTNYYTNYNNNYTNPKCFHETLLYKHIYKQLVERKLKPSENCKSYFVEMQAMASQIGKN